MKQIVITRPDYFANEPEQIIRLFEKGLQVLHLRKPDSSLADYERLIQKIPAEYYNRIVLHEHFSLLAKYNFRGVHLSKRNPSVEADCMALQQRANRITISKSCHTIEELRNIDDFDYVFLSPIFDSISKAGYRSAFSGEILQKACKDGLINQKVIALGGINFGNISLLNRYNFGGAALLGAIWYKPDRLGKYFALQFITHTNEKYDHVQSAELALAGGCRWIQLRMKDAPLDEIEKNAFKLRNMCRQLGAIFIIDDHVELVRQVDADGVHIGKADMPPEKARAILGNRFIIGGTANTFEDIKQLAIAGVDYIGLGPFRFTQTKKNLSSILGLRGYEQMMIQCRAENINLPIVAIGGIKTEDIQAIMSTGVNGIAVSGYILNAENPVKATGDILNKINVWRY